MILAMKKISSEACWPTLATQCDSEVKLFFLHINVLDQTIGWNAVWWWHEDAIQPDAVCACPSVVMLSWSLSLSFVFKLPPLQPSSDGPDGLPAIDGIVGICTQHTFTCTYTNTLLQMYTYATTHTHTHTHTHMHHLPFFPGLYSLCLACTFQVHI